MTYHKLIVWNPFKVYLHQLTEPCVAKKLVGKFVHQSGNGILLLWLRSSCFMVLMDVDLDTIIRKITLCKSCEVVIIFLP